MWKTFLIIQAYCTSINMTLHKKTNKKWRHFNHFQPDKWSVSLCAANKTPWSVKRKQSVPLKCTAVMQFLLNSLQSAEEIIVCVYPSKVSLLYVSSFLIHRKHQEDCWQIINQVHSWHKARHQDRQDRGPCPGKPRARLVLTGRCAALTPLLLLLQQLQLPLHC